MFFRHVRVLCRCDIWRTAWPHGYIGSTFNFHHEVVVRARSDDAYLDEIRQRRVDELLTPWTGADCLPWTRRPSLFDHRVHLLSTQSVVMTTTATACITPSLHGDNGDERKPIHPRTLHVWLTQRDLSTFRTCLEVLRCWLQCTFFITYNSFLVFCFLKYFCSLNWIL